MHFHLLGACLATTLCATTPLAQITVSVGPEPAPTGCPVSISVTNDTELIAAIFNCPYVIRDANLKLVHEPDCFDLELLVGPLGTVTWNWDQTDTAGQPLPAGTYFVEVGTLSGPELHPVTIGDFATGLHVEGTPAIGTSEIGLGGRFIALCSPDDAGAIHWVLAALSNDIGVSICGLTLPLDPDPLFQQSATLIPGGLGTFDASGYSDAARLPIPDQPQLIGLELELAFLVADPGAACPVVRVSDALSVVIQEGAIPFP